MNPKILFVDDEPRILSAFQAVFRRLYDVTVAPSPWQALDILKNNGPFQVVVSDIRMPGMSGVELLRRVADLSPLSVRVALTGHADLQTAGDAVNLGHVYKFLLKPCPTDILAGVLEECVAQYQRIRNANDAMVNSMLAMLHYRNLETSEHVARVGHVSAILARALGWNQEQTAVLQVAAAMHDIGKIGVPDAILLKPGALTREEFAVMQGHAGIGASILANAANPVVAMARDIALGHHERLDGSGYPQGLCGDAIPECARIVAVADVFDALVSDRVYRRALDRDAARRSIVEQGQHTFDGRIVAALCRNQERIDALYATSPPACDGDFPAVPCV